MEWEGSKVGLLRGNSWNRQGKASWYSNRAGLTLWECLRLTPLNNSFFKRRDYYTDVFSRRDCVATATEVAWAREERKVCDMKEERRRGTAEGKQTAPALLDMKPQSCLGLILPESGGGAWGVLLSNYSKTVICTAMATRRVNIDPWRWKTNLSNTMK